MTDSVSQDLPDEYAIQLSRLKKIPLVLGELSLSTITANTKFLNVNFDSLLSNEAKSQGICADKNFVRLIMERGLEPPIIGIQNMYVKNRIFIHPDYIKPPPVKSNRGRKKKQGNAKTGGQADPKNPSFKSAIEFSIYKTITRPIPKYADTNSKTAHQNGDGTETFNKTYKIKLFCNGSVTMSGILKMDYSDVRAPLQDLLNYLHGFFPNAEFTNTIVPSTVNSKCRINMQINTSELKHVITETQEGGILMSIDTIIDYYCNPQFRGDDDIRARYIDWNDLNSLDKPTFYYNDFITRVKMLSGEKSMIVKLEDLEKLSKFFNEHQVYKKIAVFLKYSKKKVVDAQPIIHRTVKKCVLASTIAQDVKSRTKSSAIKDHSKNNKVRIYAPFRNKYPEPKHKLNRKGEITETITHASPPIIIIFPKGKLNIMGSMTAEIRDLCYYWINEILYNERDRINADPTKYIDEKDPDFPSDSEGEMDDE